MQGSNNTEGSRLIASFEGRVQGVGFRFTTVEIARGYNVTGFVQNMPDGTVRLVVEGDQSVIQEFVAAIRSSHIFNYVTRESVDWQKPLGDMKSFEIRYA